MGSEPAFITLIVPLIELLNIHHALPTTILTSPLHLPLIIIEDHTQKYIHEEEDAKHDEKDEVDSVPRARIVRLEHDVREVGCCHQYKHIVICLREVAKVLYILKAIAKEIVPNC